MKKPLKSLQNWEGSCPNLPQVYYEGKVMQRKVLVYSSTRVHNRGAKMLKLI